MMPYRAASPRSNPRVDFGDPKKTKRRWAIGALLILATVTFIVLYAAGIIPGVHVNGSVLLPGVIGIALLSALTGSIEYAVDRRELVVTRRRFLFTQKKTLSIDDFLGLDVHVHSKEKPPYVHELRLARRDGTFVSLIREVGAEGIEPWRRAVSDLLVENRLPLPLAAPIRVATTGDVASAPNAPSASERDESAADVAPRRESR